jgi:hypothetical protein
LGDANTAFWTAFGIKQKLDSLGKKEALSYIAIGRKAVLIMTIFFQNRLFLF